MVRKEDFDGGLTCSLPCSDMSASIHWYENVLGFKLIFRLDDMGWCELSTPVDGVTLGLSQVERPEVRGGTTLTWGVNDIDAARSAMEAEDVPFDGETITVPETVRLATFFDPDGNKHMLYQDLGEH